MAELKGTQVAAAIVPFTDLDTYATHDAEYGKGGFRSVDTNAKRDAIPAARKVKGMVVRVNDTGLHWVWTGSAWAEWLPKGSMVVDAALNATSTNPVQNKVITPKITSLETNISILEEELTDLSDIVEDIPRITVDTVWNATSNNPASSKAIESTISLIRTTANSANAKADSALGTANAAIPKSYIDTGLDDDASDARVPSSKLLKIVSELLTLGLQNVQSSADSANAKANAAIPKSKIDTSIDGTETAHDAVPSVAATVTYVKSQRTAIDGSINSVSGRVTTLETWKNGIGNKGAANGVAGLDSTGKVPSTQLPSYVDDVIDLINFVSSNPTSGMTIGNKYYNTTSKKIFTATSTSAGVESTPEAGKIYINIATNKTYRWSGSTMAEISASLALGTTSTTAFRGDYGNTLYTNFGTGENLTGTQDARDCFAKLKRDFGSVGNASVIKTLHVNTYSNNIIIQDDILYFNGEQNNGDGFEIPAATTSKAGVMTADMYKTFQEMELATFPLDLHLAGGGTWEVGSSVKPVVSITALRKGSDITSSCDIVVTPQPSLSGSLSSNKKTWTASTNISSVYNIQVKATLNTQSITKSVIYYFKYKKYYGTSSNATLTNAQILALGGDAWADSRAMEATIFDCTGGKYPYYVIPSDIYTGLEVWVGGLKNSDITVTDITLTNDEGASKAYKVVRLTNIQTGVLSIQFK